MTTTILITEISLFGFNLWLGLYLASRNLADTRLRLAGLAVAVYALAVALDVLIAYAATAVFVPRPPAIMLLSLLFLATFWGALWRGEAFQHWQRRALMALLTIASLFLLLGTALLFFSLSGWVRFWLWLALGVAAGAFGLGVAALDAADEGEALLPHLLRSFDYAFFTALLFGGQVALVMVWSSRVTFPMLLLLLTTMTAAVAIQTFPDPFQGWLDRVAFFNAPQVRHTRAELRAVANAASRLDNALDLEAMAQDDFVRLTRRALSHMGNLPKLAASPLTRLALVEERLRKRDVQPNTLARSAELKALLSESIARLKPRNKGAFGVSDEWRHYNALYYPYVVGLKPYSRRTTHTGLNETTRNALHWFRTQVPERTLYNWQNAAAELVAQDLRERSAALNGGNDSGG